MVDYIEIAEGLRREAYVKALEASWGKDNVVGVIGSKVPYEILYSMDLIPLPVYGVDREILDYSLEEGLCSMIDATVTYGKRNRCPLIHSASLIIVDDYCPLREKEIKKLEEIGKKVYVYHFKKEDACQDLIGYLKAFYGTSFLEEKLELSIQRSKEINEKINRLRMETELSGKDIYTLEFYTRFLFSEEEQLEFLSKCVAVYGGRRKREREEIYVQGGGGIYSKIHALEKGEDYVIIEGLFCEGRNVLLSEARGFRYLGAAYGQMVDKKCPKYVYQNCCYPYNGLKIEY